MDDEWCRVFWGEHACSLTRDHDGPHKCDCGHTADWRTTLHGADAPKRRLWRWRRTARRA